MQLTPYDRFLPQHEILYLEKDTATLFTSD